MHIELSQTEVDTLLNALEAWEKETTTSMLIGEMLTAAIAPPEARAKHEAQREEKFAKDKKETDRRKYISLMLRAKLVKSLTDPLTQS